MWCVQCVKRIRSIDVGQDDAWMTLAEFNTEGSAAYWIISELNAGDLNPVKFLYRIVYR